MANDPHPYLFRNVSEEDYTFLKARESHIIEEVKEDLIHEGATSKEIARYAEVKSSFGYNPKRQALGIFLRAGRSKQLILSAEDFNLMTKDEKKVFLALRSRLEDGLEGIQIRKEDWK